MAANPQAAAPPPPVDLVTALQEALGRVNGLLFNYVGALQRDAPPQPVKGEALLAPPKAYDVQARSVGGSRGRHGQGCPYTAPSHRGHPPVPAGTACVPLAHPPSLPHTRMRAHSNTCRPRRS